MPFNHNSGAFSRKGDSGSVVVDGPGRISGHGILTGSGGVKGATDLTYVTPFSFVMRTIHKYKHLAKAYPKWTRPPRCFFPPHPPI